MTRLDTRFVVWTQVLGDIHEKYLGSQLDVSVAQVNKTIWLMDASRRSGCVWVYKLCCLFIQMFTCRNTAAAQEGKRGEEWCVSLLSSVKCLIFFFNNLIPETTNGALVCPRDDVWIHGSLSQGTTCTHSHPGEI